MYIHQFSINSTNSCQFTFTLFNNSQYIQLKKHNPNNINLKLSSIFNHINIQISQTYIYIYIDRVSPKKCIIQKLPTIFFNEYSSILNKSTNSYQLTFILFDNSQYIQLKKHNPNNIDLKLSSLSILSTSKYLKHYYEAISLLLKLKLTKYRSFSNLNIYLPEIHPNIDLEPLVALLSTYIHLDEIFPERYDISEMTSHVTQQSCNYINVQVLI